MHNSTSFAEHCLNLLKNTGPSGPTGPTTAKPFRSNDKTGTTQSEVLGPVDIDWSHDIAASGPAKNVLNRYLDSHAPSGTSGTTIFEQGREDVSAGGQTAQIHASDAELKGVPSPWIKGVARLRAMDIPDCYTADRWYCIVDDADAFLRQWGATASRLGWSAHDLFGVHPAAPFARFDAMGLVPVLHGSQVLALTETTATIRGGSGSIQRFGRVNKVQGICIWEVGR